MLQKEDPMFTELMFVHSTLGCALPTEIKWVKKWRRGELEKEAPLKTNKLLIFQYARNAQHSGIAVFTHVIHTQKFSGARELTAR
jgi:hypothetical protein